MPDEENKALAGVMKAGAELTLQAKTIVRKYRVTPIKISNITADICEIGDSVEVVAVSREQAKIEFLQALGKDIPKNDVIGNWTVRCFKVNLGE